MNTSSPWTESPLSGSVIYTCTFVLVYTLFLPTQYQVVVMDRRSAELAKHVPERAAVSNCDKLVRFLVSWCCM